MPLKGDHHAGLTGPSHGVNKMGAAGAGKTVPSVRTQPCHMDTGLHPNLWAWGENHIWHLWQLQKRTLMDT